MLTEITLRNFKSFGDEHKIPLSKINLIYGANSAGKSSIIQALLLLKQSHTDGNSSARPLDLITRGSLTDLGGFGTLIHRHTLDEKLGIAIQLNPVVLARSRARDAELKIDMSFESDYTAKESAQLSRTHYKITPGPNDDCFDFRFHLVKDAFGWSSNSSMSSYAKYLIEHTNIFSRNPIFTHQELFDSLQDSRILAQGSVLPNRIHGGEEHRTFVDKVRKSGIRSARPDFRIGDISAPLEGIVNALVNHLDRLAYLGPMRSHPERIYTISGGSRGSVGTRGEYTQHILFYDPESVDAANESFIQCEIPYQLQVDEIGTALTGQHVTITLIDSRTKTPVTPVDVGYGLNQLMPVIVEGVARKPRSLICVEQPEVHLHPRLQAHISDLIIDTALRPTPQAKQWIVETHSEMLIRRIQTRIREGKLMSSDVSLIYVDQQPGIGSVIKIIRLDEDGDFIDEWPHGFFDEGFNELMGY